MAVHLLAADHDRIGREEPRTDNMTRLNCPRCIRAAHDRREIMTQLKETFTVDATKANTVVLTLNREQAAKLAEVLSTCTDDSVLRLDWDEPETADLVKDLNGQILSSLDGTSGVRS